MLDFFFKLTKSCAFFILTAGLKLKSETECNGNKVTIRCSTSSEVIVFHEISWGSTGSSFRCRNRNNIYRSCLSTSSSEGKVKDLCFGKNSCSFNADRQTLGNPARCRLSDKPILSYKYSCQQRKLVLVFSINKAIDTFHPGMTFIPRRKQKLFA